MTTALNADAATSPAFNQLLQSDYFESILKGDANQQLRASLRSDFTVADNVSLLSSIISRVDLT